jgi:putative transposase
MQVERHFHPGNPEIVRLCKLAKELYNRCNYLMRKSWFSQQHLKIKQLPDINVLVRETQSLDCFKEFRNTKMAKQIVRLVLSDWSNYRKSLVAYGRDSSKFIKCPKPPGYKEKMGQLVFYNETIRGGQTGRKLSQLTATNDCFSIPCDKNYKQVVITPKAFGFVIEVRYEPEPKEKTKVPGPKLDRKKVCTIDLGVNVLAAITLDQIRPILINGRIVKGINRWYNKRQCPSRLRKRYFRLENYFHHVSKFIVDLCLENGSGRIIIGKNDGWKQGVKMRKKEKQAFQSIPFDSLLGKIKYKAAMAGIEVTFTEEAYTSQASFYGRDPLPLFDEDPPKFSGTRKFRGLYVTDDGFAVNADVNASMNIGRKVIPEFSGIGDRSVAATPVTVNPLKVGR